MYSWTISYLYIVYFGSSQSHPLSSPSNAVIPSPPCKALSHTPVFYYVLWPTDFNQDVQCYLGFWAILIGSLLGIQPINDIPR